LRKGTNRTSTVTTHRLAWRRSERRNGIAVRVRVVVAEVAEVVDVAAVEVAEVAGTMAAAEATVDMADMADAGRRSSRCFQSKFRAAAFAAAFSSLVRDGVNAATVESTLRALTETSLLSRGTLLAW